MKNGEIISVNKLNLKNNRKFDIEVKGPHVYFANDILVHNCKMDGMYANGNILDDLQFVSRQGSVMPMEHFKAIADSVKDINGYQTHGELLVKQDGKILPRTTSNGILTSILKGGKFEDNQVPVYVVWDIIPIEYAKKKGKYKVPYFERLAN